MQDSIAKAAPQIEVIDSVAMPIPGEEKSGIILINPASEYRKKEGVKETSRFEGGMSWIYLLFTLLFCVVGIKFKGNKKYLKALIDDLVDMRLRHNVFDETVRETSLLITLNIAWVLCFGVLLWVLVSLTSTSVSGMDIRADQSMGIAICVGVSALYLVCSLLSYTVVGNVFADRKLARLWVKGAAASTGLATFLLFPLSLIALNYEGQAIVVLIIAAVVFAIGKIVFIYKGFRIFFAEISSWMHFLYYLCSLEIVPLIMTYIVAVAACTAWL